MRAGINPALVYGLFAVYVVAGLVAYERFGTRLGGVLVLPYLGVYALGSPSVLFLFAIATVVTFAVGEVIHRNALLYGRRMLIAYVLVSLVASLIANALVGVSLTGVFLPILPGLMAYNLHREGRALWDTTVFVAAVVVTLSVTQFALSLLGWIPNGSEVANR